MTKHTEKAAKPVKKDGKTAAAEGSREEQENEQFEDKSPKMSEQDMKEQENEQFEDKSPKMSEQDMKEHQAEHMKEQIAEGDDSEVTLSPKEAIERRANENQAKIQAEQQYRS